MKIIIDAMGGDNAPAAVVAGAVSAQKELGVDIILVGREAEILKCLAENGAAAGEHITVVNASEVVEMEDNPGAVKREKKDSSMIVGLNRLNDGEGDAFVSAGSTGALLAGATFVVKRIRGIRRACLAPVLSNGAGGALLIDCGANAVCTPEFLLQFAFMGSFYAKKILGCASPRVGLLNIGAEESKGTPLQKESYALLRQADEAGRIRFIGNVEGSDIFFDKADVVVADGFSGNIMLKSIEGTARFLMKNLKNVFLSSGKAKVGALLLKDQLDGLKKLLDPSEVGGTAFLGISKPVIKAHGGSDARAIRGAVRQAAEFAAAGIIDEIKNNIEYMRLRETGEDHIS